MELDCKYLFIYGTLMDAGNEFGAYLKTYSTHYATGHFPGLLYNLGEYPGAIYNPQIPNMVYGDIVSLSNEPGVLKAIDEYEGFGEDEDQPNLFIREMIAVTTPLGTIDCWVYLYNLQVDGFRLITSGRYK